ncbi:RNA-directed DNA polymerase, eukaryota [Tanacetum coccineum]
MEMGEKKLTWINWKKTMARKEDGGLGIGSLYGFNMALLYKWKWRFRTTQMLCGLKSLKIYLVMMVAYWRPDVQEGGGAESDQWNQLLSLLSTCTLSSQKDRWVWSGDETGGFTIVLAMSIIDTDFLGTDNTPTRWSKDVPIKINVFMWKLLFDKLLTRNNLEKKGLNVHSILCGICDDVTETASHVFLRCEFSLEIWRQIARWWDLDIPHMLSMKELLGWVNNLKISKIQKKGKFVEWVKSIKGRMDGSGIIKEELNRIVDADIDKGPSFLCSLLIEYVEVIKSIPNTLINSVMDLAQVGLQVKWAIEGDEKLSIISWGSLNKKEVNLTFESWWDIEYSDVNSFTEWINWMASLRLQSKVKMMIQGVFFVVWWLVWSYRNKLLFEEKKPSKAIIFDDVVCIVQLG